MLLACLLISPNVAGPLTNIGRELLCFLRGRPSAAVEGGVLGVELIAAVLGVCFLSLRFRHLQSFDSLVSNR
jgi:hypothetical protein